MINETCALGIIPCGSGNGVARHLNVPLKLEKAIIRIASFNRLQIDTGLVNDTPFIGTCGFGFDAHIAEKFDSFGKRGFLSYAKLVMREYSNYNPPVFRVKGKDLELEKTAIMCSVANSSQFGNGFTISPNSDIQDGIFELVFLDRFKWLNAPRITRKFFSKSIHTSKHFSTFAFTENITVSVDTKFDSHYHIDGEPIAGNHEFNVSISPKSLWII